MDIVFKNVFEGFAKCSTSLNTSKVKLQPTLSAITLLTNTAERAHEKGGKFI
jgi:hypothetical protein